MCILLSDSAFDYSGVIRHQWLVQYAGSYNLMFVDLRNRLFKVIFVYITQNNTTWLRYVVIIIFLKSSTISVLLYFLLTSLLNKTYPSPYEIQHNIQPEELTWNQKKEYEILVIWRQIKENKFEIYCNYSYCILQ